MTSLFAILDHTRSRRGGPNLLFKFDFGILIIFGYIAILVFCHFACKMPNHTHFLVNFWGSYPQNLTLIILTPKKAHPWVKTRRLSHQPCKSIQGFDMGARPRTKKNRTGHTKVCPVLFFLYVGARMWGSPR